MVTESHGQTEMQHNPPPTAAPEDDLLLDDSGSDERRRDRRKPVIKSAKIIFNELGSVLNCYVLDESSGGVQVDLGAVIDLPDDLTIQFGTGATYLARRCWTAGTKVGLEFTSGQLVSEETASRMRKIAELLQAQGFGAAVRTLRAARFFDHDELRRAATEAEDAMARFTTILQGG